MRIRSPKVVTDGRVVRADHVDPGSPLLRSRYEWNARYRKYMVLDLVTNAVLLVIVLSVVVAVLYAVMPDARLGVLIVLVVLAAVLVPDALVKAPVGQSFPPGLYREGLMHPRGFFVPYGELRDIRVEPPAVPLLMQPKVSLQPYFDQPGEDYSGWDFEAHILGDDGVEMLRSKVAEINEQLGD